MSHSDTMMKIGTVSFCTTLEFVVDVTCAIVICVKKGLNPSIVWVNSSTIIVVCCSWWLWKIVVDGEF
jgi:hypothetical protein